MKNLRTILRALGLLVIAGLLGFIFRAGSVEAANGKIISSQIADATIAYNNIDNTATIAGNPAFAAGEAWFGTTGVIFEGSTADTIEGLLTVADPTASDKTWTLPNVTGTVVTTGDTGTVTATMLATSSVQPVKIEGLAHTADTVRIRTPQLLTINYTAASFDANDDIVLTFAAGHAVLVLDMFVNQTTAEGGALTATLRDTANGGGSAISGSVDLNSAAGTVLRPTTFIPKALAASGSVYLKASANPGTTAGAVSLLFVYTD